MTRDTLPKTAVLQVCDANYLPFALHLVSQILHLGPHRRFDIVIASDAALAFPQWATDAGLRLHRMSPGDLPPDLPDGRLGRTAYYRIKAFDQLADRYARILYLDSDLFLEGGDLDRLLDIGMGDHAIAAVMDSMFFEAPGGHAIDLKAAGLPRRPYLNTGVMVVDTASYVRARLSARSIEVLQTMRQAILFADQTALNIALEGRFAQLSPVWNWMNNREYPLVPRRLPVRIHHFIGPVKPWNDTRESLDLRFRESYATFFRNHLPEALPLLAPANARLLPLDRLVSDLLAHARRRRVNAARFGAFRDEWDVRT